MTHGFTLRERARKLREHAMSVSAADRHASVLAPAEEYVEVGYNYRLSNLLAAMGRAQLGRLPEVVERRRQIAATYAKQIAELPGLLGLVIAFLWPSEVGPLVVGVPVSLVAVVLNASGPSAVRRHLARLRGTPSW